MISGGEHYTGAAVLSVTAAVTAGVGMVRYVGPDAPTGLLRSLVPEAVHGAGRVQAWAIGSGLVVQDASQEQLQVARAALASDLPVLLDAGGLDLLERPRAAGGGYLIRPSTVEFWQGRENRLHNRIRVSRTAGGWQKERLQP